MTDHKAPLNVSRQIRWHRYHELCRLTLVCVWLTALLVAPTVALNGRAQTGLEEQLEQLFLREHASLDDLAEVGSGDAVQAVLVNMVVKHKYAEQGTKEYLYLQRAARALGTIKVKKGVQPLGQVLFDAKVHENVRADAARSLGQIDPEGSKQLLLKALANRSQYVEIRANAAEALGKTKDAQVANTLEKYSQEEQDPYVREKFSKAAKEIRARSRGTN